MSKGLDPVPDVGDQKHDALEDAVCISVDRHRNRENDGCEHRHSIEESPVMFVLVATDRNGEYAEGKREPHCRRKDRVQQILGRVVRSVRNP